ncbi:MAG: O-antigen ligase family protein [Candidatus Pararuminococcus gallinarum]
MGKEMTTQNRVKEKMPLLISLFIIAHPLIDIATALGTRAGLSITFGVVVRVLFMVCMAAYVCFIAQFKNKKLCCAYLGAVILYCVFFLFYFLIKGGISAAFGNLKELIKVFYFSFILVSFYALYKQKNFVVSNKILTLTVVGYMAVIFIAFITNTGFTAYNYGFGNNGWFYAANEIGAIVSILIPVAILFAFQVLVDERRNFSIWIKAIAIIALGLVCFCSTYIGTKVVFIGIIGYIICSLIWSLIVWLCTKDKKKLVQMVICLAMCLVIAISYFANSPLRKNIQGVMMPNYEEIKKPIKQEIEKPDTEQKENLSAIIQSKSFRVANWLLSNRLTNILPIHYVFSQQGLLSQFIGIGYVDLDAYEASIQTAIECDPFALLYRHGFMGLLLFYAPIIGIFFYMLFHFLRRFTKLICSLSFCTYLYSFILGLGISTLAGHTLVAPAVSVFVAIIAVKLMDHESLKDIVA